MDDTHYTTPLQHLGVIRATGEDALQFLHNQLTQDMLQHTADAARRSGWCSAKGRLLANFISVLHGDDVLLIGSADLLQGVLKRLRMFVLRARCTLEDASAQFVLVGSFSSRQPEQPALSAQAFMPVTVLENAAENTGIRIQLPAGAGDAARWSHQLNLLPCSENASASTMPDGSARHTAIWLWLELMTGVATVSAAVRELFVPQMLNCESTATVNFRKGCYPGQEVVARSQFRGKLKRRAFLAQCSAPAAAGADVYSGDSAVGTVVQTAEHPEYGAYCIFSATVASTEDGTLHVKSPDGDTDTVLTLLPLPYELLDDI